MTIITNTIFQVVHSESLKPNIIYLPYLFQIVNFLNNAKLTTKQITANNGITRAGSNKAYKLNISFTKTKLTE